MASAESIFIKEFNRNIRSASINKDIFSIKLPEEVKNWSVSGSDLLAVNGIPDSSGVYYGLNRSIVKKLPRGVVASKRKVDIVTRDFVRDENNRYVYEDVKIPKGSMVIVSNKSLAIPYGYKSEDGFGYVDFIQNGKNREYLYIVPKVYLYETHQTALALSVKNMKNFKGMGYQTWENGVIYLHIIPYKPNSTYVGSKILKTSHKLDYGKEIKSIVDFWIKERVIPNVALCETEDRGNLVLKPTARGYMDYSQREELSLGEKEIYGENVDSASEEE